MDNFLAEIEKKPRTPGVTAMPAKTTKKATKPKPKADPKPTQSPELNEAASKLTETQLARVNRWRWMMHDAFWGHPPRRITPYVKQIRRLEIALRRKWEKNKKSGRTTEFAVLFCELAMEDSGDKYPA